MAKLGLSETGQDWSKQGHKTAGLVGLAGNCPPVYNNARLVAKLGLLASLSRTDGLGSSFLTQPIRMESMENVLLARCTKQQGHATIVGLVGTSVICPEVIVAEPPTDRATCPLNVVIALSLTGLSLT